MKSGTNGKTSRSIGLIAEFMQIVLGRRKKLLKGEEEKGALKEEAHIVRGNEAHSIA